MTCYNNPCNKCNSCSKCGSSCCEHKSDSCCNLHVDWVPHTNCAISVSHDKCSDTLDLCPGIKKCQSVTHMNWNGQTGCIEYENEKYVYSDGTEDSLERICVSDFLPFINLNDLADVQFDNELLGNCYELIYKKDLSCGPNCNSIGDHWENWNINYPGAKVQSMDYIRGANEDGCPVYLDKPDNCSFLVFSPSCTAPTGEWQAWQIPDAGDCVMSLDNGCYKVLTKDACGCIKECKMPIIPSGTTSINFIRDSLADDPDFPWYYGNYNDEICLHLADNAPDYFGKYDLKVTINYGVQVIKSDKYAFNYNWRSLVTPYYQGQSHTTISDKSSAILQNWGMADVLHNIPWGSSALRGSIAFVVPKGKEGYLHHEYRIRVNPDVMTQYGQTWPGYLVNATYDGKKVPDIEATLNGPLWPASRLNALQVIVEPTQGYNDYTPTADAIRNQLDAAVDDQPLPY